MLRHLTQNHKYQHHSDKYLTLNNYDLQLSATVQVKVWKSQVWTTTAVGRGVSFCSQARKSCPDYKTMTFSWLEGLIWSKHWNLIRWIGHKMTQLTLPEGWGPPTWPLKDVMSHLKALRGEMPIQHLALTQQNDVGLQSNIKVALKWKQFDIAREENEEMRLMLWGEWVGGGMRKGSQSR